MEKSKWDTIFEKALREWRKQQEKRVKVSGNGNIINGGNNHGYGIQTTEKNEKENTTINALNTYIRSIK